MGEVPSHLPSLHGEINILDVGHPKTPDSCLALELLCFVQWHKRNLQYDVFPINLYNMPPLMHQKP